MNFAALLRSLRRAELAIATAPEQAFIARGPVSRSWTEGATRMRRHRVYRKARNAMQRASRRGNRGA